MGNAMSQHTEFSVDKIHQLLGQMRAIPAIYANHTPTQIRQSSNGCQIEF
jgi:hypothetical protein